MKGKEWHQKEGHRCGAGTSRGLCSHQKPTSFQTGYAEVSGCLLTWTFSTLLVSATDPAYAPDFPSFGFSFHLIQLDLLSSFFASAEAARREDRKLDRILRKF